MSATSAGTFRPGRPIDPMGAARAAATAARPPISMLETHHARARLQPFLGSLSGTWTCTLHRWIGLSSLLRGPARIGTEGRCLSRTDLISCPCLQSAAWISRMPPLCLAPNCAARLQCARSVSRSGAGGLRGGAVMRSGAVRGWLAMALCRTPARSVWASVGRAPSR